MREGEQRRQPTIRGERIALTYEQLNLINLSNPAATGASPAIFPSELRLRSTNHPLGLPPVIAALVEALARVQEERDHQDRLSQGAALQ